MESIALRTKQRGMCALNDLKRCLARGGKRHGGLLGLVIAAALALAAHPAAAQNTGTIFGTVEDRSGAAVARATVTVADTDHGINRSVQTNATGEYNFAQLPVGTYILTVAAGTFETAVVTDIKVDAEGNVKEQITLVPGAANETVSVEDTSGSAIDAKSATLGTLIDQKLIEDLPIDGHNVVALSALLPGVVDVNAPSTFTGDTAGPTYAASGSRSTQNLFLFDGIIFNNLYYNTGVNYPTPNALQEISVLLNNYKAQYGRNAGSIFNVITKRGTNNIHGAVWDYLQNQVFNAADYISRVNPKDNQNQFGVQIGGPILKDKLFFAGAYQQLIGRLQTTGSALTPGYAERGLTDSGTASRPCVTPIYAGQRCASFLGDVTTNGVPGKFTNPLSLTGTSGNQATSDLATTVFNNIYQKATGSTQQSPCVTLLTAALNYAASNNYLDGKSRPTYLPNAEVPYVCLDPVIVRGDPANQGIGGNIANQGLFDRYVPLPTPGQNGYAVTKSPDPTGDRNGLIRIDYNLNDRNTFDFRYNVVSSSQNAPTGVDSSSQGIATYELVQSGAKVNFGDVGFVHIVTPNLLTTTRVGYKRFETTQFPQDPTNLNSFGASFQLPGQPTLPAITISNQFNAGSVNNGYQDHINESFQVSEAINWTKGNHSIQGGYDFLRFQYLNRSDYPGLLAFSTTYTGVALADAELGLANSVSAQNRLIQGGIQHNNFFYLQEDWRTTARLTLNLGVRYEIPFQWFEPHGKAATFVPGIQSTIFPNAPGGLAFPGDRGVLPSLVPTDFHGIAPRLGFVYDASGVGKFLVRGGFGIVFDAVNANVVGVGQPYHYSFQNQTPIGGASVPLLGAGVNANGQRDGSTLIIPDQFDPANPQFITPYQLFFPDPHFRTPYVLATNFGFQYHLPHAGVLDANYVGKFARKLTIPVDLNPAIFDCTGGYFQSDPNRYCNSAASTTASTRARARYLPYNTGGQGIVDIQSVANSSYNALQVQYTQRGGKYLNILSSYTYSRSIDIATNGQTTANQVPNVLNLASDRGPSDSNATHNFTLGWVVRYPKVTGGNFITRAVLNDWVYTGQYLAHTGRPFSVTINNDTALNGESRQRAYLLPGVSPYLPSNRHRADKVNEYFNTDAFSYPTRGTFSNVGRNAFVGPGYILTNMTVGRDFPLASIREGMRLNFRAEAFNVFNTPNLANPNSQFSCSSTSISGQVGAGGALPATGPQGCVASGDTLGGIIPGTGRSAFGQVRSTFGNNANTSTNGRKMQFALTAFF